MQDLNRVKPPVWFWVLCSILLVWNALGVMAFFQYISITAEQIQRMNPQEQSLYVDQPGWVTLAFALAVFAGALGCLTMLFRRALAKWILVLSAVGVMVQMFHNFVMANTMDVYGPGAVIMPIMVLLIALFLIWFATKATNKGWLY